MKKPSISETRIVTCDGKFSIEYKTEWEETEYYGFLKLRQRKVKKTGWYPISNFKNPFTIFCGTLEEKTDRYRKIFPTKEAATQWILDYNKSMEKEVWKVC